ncbi:hypothetical protein [Fusarium redolens polymycovirus 1]|uniref:Uncharacterized protein n=1 Tax=Fusarium redolens polymycovirus 1 TaxID=2546034 RepID=A0A513ZVE3_9VIRU|nr:hypothetical protein KM555_s7gp2 [Fusarium redolens polymycovirus 1]QDH44663.1 hypothetical protein [Fusarium redolens polymycovirus 1]
MQHAGWLSSVQQLTLGCSLGLSFRALLGFSCVNI